MKSLSAVNHRGAASEGSHRAKGATSRVRRAFPSRPATKRVEACHRQMTLLASASKPGGAEQTTSSRPCLGRRAALFSVPLIGVEHVVPPPHLPSRGVAKFVAGDMAAAREDLSKRLIETSPMAPTGRFAPPWKQQKIIYFPEWMEGSWQVTSTGTGFSAPQGKQFMPPGAKEEAEKDIGASISYTLKFIDAQGGSNASTADTPRNIVSDKRSNIKSVTNAFQGYEALETVEYDQKSDPGRLTATFGTTAPDGSRLPPQRIELYVNHTESQDGKDELGNPTFYTSELFRQVFVGVRRVEVNDYEICMAFTLQPDGTVVARQRNVVYLQPQDAAYFDAGGRAVGYYDYSLTMARESSGVPQ